MVGGLNQILVVLFLVLAHEVRVVEHRKAIERGDVADIGGVVKRGAGLGQPLLALRIVWPHRIGGGLFGATEIEEIARHARVVLDRLVAGGNRLVGVDIAERHARHFRRPCRVGIRSGQPVAVVEVLVDRDHHRFGVFRRVHQIDQGMPREFGCRTIMKPPQVAFKGFAFRLLTDLLPILVGAIADLLRQREALGTD